MNQKEFERTVDLQIGLCLSTLTAKAGDYAVDTDRLHNFRIAAAIQGETLEETIAGMMVKHTVSIYDMCRSNETFHIADWNEKITDHINYLLLLKAAVAEKGNEA